MPDQNDSQMSFLAGLRRSPALTAGMVLAAVALSGGGYLLGAGENGTVWQEGQAYVGQEKASIQADGRTYGISKSVAWVDANGSLNEGGWPDCLSVPVGSTVSGVRFSTVDVMAEGLGWSQVVLLDCRGR